MRRHGVEGTRLVVTGKQWTVAARVCGPPGWRRRRTSSRPLTAVAVVGCVYIYTGAVCTRRLKRDGDREDENDPGSFARGGEKRI